MRDPAAAEGLLRLLDQEVDVAILLQAVGALGEMGWEGATPRLVCITEGTAPSELRAAAACALGGTGGEGATSALRSLVVGDPSVEVRRAAAGALAMAGEEDDAVKVLRECVLKESDVGVQRAIVVALGRLRASVSVDELLVCLKSPELQERTAWALGEIASPEAAVPLLSVAETAAGVGTRAHAVDSLGKLGGERIRNGLLRIAERDGSPFVRRRAVRALSSCVPPPSAEALLRLLGQESDVIVRGALVEALGQGADKGAVGPLSTLASSAGHWYVRRAAVGALAGMPGATDVLRLALRDTHSVVRTAAREALEKVPKQSTSRATH